MGGGELFQGFVEVSDAYHSKCGIRAGGLNPVVLHHSKCGIRAGGLNPVVSHATASVPLIKHKNGYFKNSSAV